MLHLRGAGRVSDLSIERIVGKGAKTLGRRSEDGDGVLTVKVLVVRV